MCGLTVDGMLHARRHATGRGLREPFKSWTMDVFTHSRATDSVGPIVYEQPLNERIRNFLRIEHLLRSARHSLGGDTAMDSRSVLDAIIGMLDVITRIDIKKELAKELERHAGALTRFKASPDVDHERLDDIRERVEAVLGTLRNGQYQPGMVLRENELISTVRNRYAIPGGTCDFDLPGYHYWLEQPPAARRADLEAWLGDLDIIGEAVHLGLQLIRGSTSPARETAAGGFFQQALDPSISCQLIRIILPADTNVYPEISAGKHRFTIRFMQQDSTSVRPVQTGDDIEFDLHCCVI